MYSAYEREDEVEEPMGGSGLKSRLRGLFSGWGRRPEDDEEEEFESTPPRMATSPRPMTNPVTASHHSPIRLTSVRDGSITIMPAASFADVQKAADRLKQGEPQILNLEKTPPDVAARLIDFLNGVTYALDGYVEKVAEGAYLFTPANVMIHADKPETQPKPFFDRL